MFDRYNEAARRSLFFARYEAGALGSATIETEHLLVGLLKQGDALVEQLIGWPRLTATDVRQRIQDRVGSHARVPDSSEIPFSEDTKLVIAYTTQESERLLHRHVGPEHQLLGLLRLERGLAWEILREKGLSLTAVREALVVHVSATSPPPPEIASMFPDHRGHAQRPSADVYILTTLDGPAPGRRTAADEGASGGFVSISNVGFSTRADQPPDGAIHSIGPISMWGTTVAEFAQVLENFLGRPVIDGTGITDSCDIELTGEYETPEAVIKALRDQLGLELTKSL